MKSNFYHIEFTIIYYDGTILMNSFQHESINSENLTDYRKMVDDIDSTLRTRYKHVTNTIGIKSVKKEFYKLN